MIELAGIIILGILAQWLAWKIKVPAILPLILIGLLVGPISTFWTADGEKLLEPIFRDNNIGVFPEKYFFSFVSLAIGLILFEGGLTLKRRELSGVGPVILKLISIGSITTFVGGGLAAHYFVNLSWPISFLFSGLIIVTGPTVIAPILQNIPLNRNVSTVLKWEGILIDPIGALVGVLVFEFILSSGGLEFTSTAFIQFFRVILIGIALGALSAYLLYQLIKHELIPHYLLNVFTLAFVLGIFVFSHVLAHESGLLSVVIMGMVLGNLELPSLQDILYFKESLSVLLISILFILLAANIEVAELEYILNDWGVIALFAFVALVLRPLGVFLSTRKSELSFKEKLFISWVGPRGIVAAGIASLFGISLTSGDTPVEDAEYLTALVFMIVLGTVLLNATTARLVAKMLGVTLDKSEGILFVGASAPSRIIAEYLKGQGRHVVLIDNNDSSIRKARKMGLEAFPTNIYQDDLEDKFDLLDMGYMVAMTSSPDVNNYVVRKYQKIFGENGTYRVITEDELKKDKDELPTQGIFSYSDDFLNISEVARDYPNVHEVEVRSAEHLKKLLSQMNFDKFSIPIFVKDLTGDLKLIPVQPANLGIKEGFKLVYLGRRLESMEEKKEEEVEV